MSLTVNRLLKVIGGETEREEKREKGRKRETWRERQREGRE